MGRSDISSSMGIGSGYVPLCPSAWADDLNSGREFLMLDVIFIMGVMVSTAGLLSAPCRRRPRPCREDDTGASSRAGLLQQKDILSTAIRELEFDFQTGK